MTRSPNILYVMFDQAKASAMSFMGNKEISMPYCETLAKQGWVFENAYAAAPICTPSRSSVHTGLFPQVHGVTCHQNRAPYNVPQLAEILQAAGYYTVVAGHYEPERNLSRGWHEQAPMHERGPLFKSWEDHKDAGRKDIAWSSGSIDVEASAGNSALLTDRAIRMMEQARASDQPFFMHMCYDDPHPPYFVPRPYDTMFDPNSLTLPQIGEIDDLPEWHKKVRQEVGTDAASEGDYRKVLAVYYGMIRYIDDEMARLHNAMESLGMLENTWVILGSDHGDYTGEKGLFNKSESLYKCLLHVPLIIVPPKTADEPGPRRVKGLTSSVDLFPTILDIAGVMPPENQGRNLLSWVRGGHREPLHHEIYAQIGDYHGFIGTSWPSGMPKSGRHPSLCHCIRTMERAYIIDPDNGDEAYDLRSDPNELRNLLNAEALPLETEFKDMKRRLEAFIVSCGDLAQRLGVVKGDRGFVNGWE